MKIGMLGRAFMAALLVGLATQALAAAALIVLQRLEAPGDALLLVAIGGPLVLSILAGVWTYRHPPTDMFENDRDDEPWVEPSAISGPPPRRRRRGPRSRRCAGP